MKLGYGFSDSLDFSKKKPKRRGGIFPEEEKTVSPGSRLGFFYLLLLSFFLILIGRLFYLQVLTGEHNRQISEENRIRVKALPAPRGVITDRKGEVLVRNIPGYRLKIENSECGEPICPPQFRPVNRQNALQIEARSGIQAASLEVDILREYLYPEILAHVLGYTGEITRDELESLKQERYLLGDKIGRSGIERQYEKILKGQKGQQVIEVDAQEKKLDILDEIAPQAGQNLALAIDLDLQKVAYEALGEEKGVVIASKAQTGEILTLVSRPSFNPNLFTLEKNEEKMEKLLSSKDEMPFLNRAISGTYPPGSTFKIVAAAAGLEEGKISPETQIEDIGEIVIGPYRFPNWYLLQYGKTEGILDIVRAIARSNDIFFYKIAEWVGEKTLGDWAFKFGLGQKLGIDLEEEGMGLIPTHKWKEENVGEKWYLGDTYHFGIGQGYILSTPLQVHSWTSTIASGGTLFKPNLLKNAEPVVIRENFLESKTIDLIREGMRQACSEGGTGWPLFKFKVGEREIQTACKTGTAEYGDPKDKTHAWFTVFAPTYSADLADSADKPEIVVTVLVEGGGEGSSVAAPIAKKVLEEWFGR